MPDHLPVDPNASIPDSVKRAAEQADALHKQVYEQPVEPPPESADEAPPAPAEPAPTEVAPPSQPPSQPPMQVEPHDDSTASWEHRYNSMKGRFEASQRTIQQMQDQMRDLGDELVRTQGLLQSLQQTPAPAAQPLTKKFITQDDEDNFGGELIDVARRAAMEAIGPELDSLRNENKDLRDRVQNSAKRDVVSALNAEVPNWRAVNRAPEFKHWLSLRDIYSGAVRKQMLDVAYQAADAPRVVAFFKGFLAEAHQSPAPAADTPPPTQQEPPAKAPAIPLETLSAPGRARQASADVSPGGGAKPIYTRAQISKFYADVRRGAYHGRETEKAALEADIFAAQSEGRVR